MKKFISTLLVAMLFLTYYIPVQAAQGGVSVTPEQYYHDIQQYLDWNDYGGERIENGQIVIYAVSDAAEKNIKKQVAAIFPKANNIKYARVKYSMQVLAEVMNTMFTNSKKYNIWNQAIDYRYNRVNIQINKDAPISKELQHFIDTDPNGGCIRRIKIVVKVSGPKPAYADKIASMQPINFPIMTQDEQLILEPIHLCFQNRLSRNDYGGICFYYDTLYIFAVDKDKVAEIAASILPKTMKVKYIKTTASLNILTRVGNVLKENKAYNIVNVGMSSERNLLYYETNDDKINTKLREYINSSPYKAYIIRQDWDKDPPVN